MFRLHYTLSIALWFTVSILKNLIFMVACFLCCFGLLLAVFAILIPNLAPQVMFAFKAKTHHHNVWIIRLLIRIKSANIFSSCTRRTTRIHGLILGVEFKITVVFHCLKVGISILPFRRCRTVLLDLRVAFDIWIRSALSWNSQWSKILCQKVFFILHRK